jgi:NAD+-dependent secondary alcohol dehydrogenase Adh1
MKAVQVAKYGQPPELVEVPEPEVTDPFDVVVRIGGAGVCRTDLHIIEGQWEEKSGVTLPYTLGHENAGWVHEVGSAVRNVAVGDPVILHPLATCGLCRACRDGDDVHCAEAEFPTPARWSGSATRSNPPAWPRWPTPASPRTTPSGRRPGGSGRGSGSW